ncbi:MAG: acetate--CoA ligase family protein [Alphaproteobacteria bacterium]|nr:MAG: acetate--CoA ligase family protein [Alphaproteobacteria bacterium]
MQARERDVAGTQATSVSLFRSVATTLAGKSLAIVGASERARWPSEIFRNLREFGYPGQIALVNPRQKEVFGQRCFPSLRDLPEPVDHALVIVPAPAVADVLTAAEERGVGSATVYASMLGDGDAPESKARGTWLEQFTAKSRLRVAGPNCMGAYSYRERLFGYPNTDLCRLAPGSVACIFQSGGLLQFWMKAAAERGLRYSYCITSGNEPDLGLADYLNFVVDDPHTRQIVLFVEGIRRPQAFMHAAGRALALGKPILAIKTGATVQSQAASQSHTGAIAGDYAAYLAMCERYGIVNHRSLDDLIETALAFEGGRSPKGPRIGFVTNSGATVDLLYDYAEAEGATIPDFTEETKAALLPLMQAGITPRNPLDVGIPSTLEVAAKQCESAARDPNIDMVAWTSPMPRTGEPWGDAAALRQLLDKTDKPIVAFGRVIQQLSDEQLALHKAAGFPFLQGIEPTIRALGGLWFHAARRGRLPATPAPAPPSDVSPATLQATLARYGIALPESEAVANAFEAANAAERIGFPVALKIRSRDILHKTEVGGVALDLQNGDAVKAAAEELTASIRAAQPSVRIDGFLVQEMVDGVEAIVGGRSDPFYGPLLLIGSGGVLVELVNDAALRLLPVCPEEVAAMIDDLRLARRLSGFRGGLAADRAALEAAALALGRFFLDHRARVKEIEINPLIVRSIDGSPRAAGPDPAKPGVGAIAVDVRVLWQEGVKEA